MTDQPRPLTKCIYEVFKLKEGQEYPSARCNYCDGDHWKKQCQAYTPLMFYRFNVRERREP